MARLKQLWFEIKSSFWFIPAIINIVLVFLAFTVIQLDHFLAASRHPIAVKLFTSFQQESVRTFLATIAGSMITLAGVVFSITILVLAQTAGQYSSRVLRNFMHQKSNQMILGVFVGIFIFCLYLITNLHPTDNGLTALSGFFLAIVGVGFLIYYVHQTSISIQASEIINNVYLETIEGINHLYPKLNQNQGDPLPGPYLRYNIPSVKTGYVQAMDAGTLFALALEYDAQISIKKRVGEFVSKGEVLCTVEKNLVEDAKFTTRIFHSVIIGKYRTAHEDVAFGIQQIVDIALRGLSPGINDLSTAQTAIDYLGSVYIALVNRDLGRPFYYKDKRPMLFIPNYSFKDFVEMGLNAICSNAKNQPTIQENIKSTIQTVKGLTQDPERKVLFDAFYSPTFP